VKNVLKVLAVLMGIGLLGAVVVAAQPPRNTSAAKPGVVDAGVSARRPPEANFFYATKAGHIPTPRPSTQQAMQAAPSQAR
jgi:hypothetical protein